VHATHRIGRIERLGDGDKSCLMALELLDQLMKIQQ
jgi:hypothetical protein